MLPERDFVFAISMDLRWLDPKGAQQVLETGISNGLLLRSGGGIKPTFDYAAIEIPVDFHPSPEQLLGIPKLETPADTKANTGIKGKEDMLFLQVLDRLIKNTRLDRRNAVAGINKKQRAMNIDIEVAGLMVCAANGISVADLIPSVEELVLSRARIGEKV